jgi:hypothetical protein
MFPNAMLIELFGVFQNLRLEGKKKLKDGVYKVEGRLTQISNFAGNEHTGRMLVLISYAIPSNS